MAPPTRSALLILAVAAAALLPAAAASAADVTPAASVVVGSPTITVNNGPGDQLDGHISGALVSYTDFSGNEPAIRYQDLATASDAAIPDPDGGVDIVSSIRGSTVVYTHVIGAKQAIYEFDTSDPSTPPHEVDPQTTSLRDNPSVGDQLIAWEDFGFDPSAPEIVVYDRTTNTAQRLTNDAEIDVNPAVSPTGASLTWTKCTGPSAGCHIWSATRSGSVWTQHELTTSGEAELPGTDGAIAAYDVNVAGEQDVYWQPIGGGTESRLVMSGQERNANVSDGVISFEHRDSIDASWDVYAYDANTGVLYSVTSNAGDEILSDISVSGGVATVTWSVQEASGGYNLYAKSFELDQPPHLTADHSQVEVPEGSPAANTGTVSDPNGDTVTLSASVGHVTNNGDGTWSWSYAPGDGPADSQPVTITGQDPTGLHDSTTFGLVVDNVAPTATFNSPSSAAPSSSFTLSLTSPSDPSAADTAAGFTYAFDCGDGGGYSTFGSASSRSCTAPAAPGPITVHGKIQDKDSGVRTYNGTVQVTTPATPIAFTSTRDGNSEIYSMNGDGTGVTRLTNNPAIDANPAWSPDHTKIAFVSTRDGWSDIYVMNANGSGVTRLTTTHGIDATPAWSPGGTKIAFSTNRDGNFEIYSMNANGTGVTRLTSNKATDVSPSWSGDGSKIAFSTNRDGNFEIYSMNANGTGVTRLTNNARADVTPDWSADGSKIVFSTDRDGNFEIYSMNANGTGVTRLTNNARSDITPAWTPTGAKIVFSTDRDGNFEVYSMNPNGTSPTRLTSNPAIDTLPDA